MRVTTAFSRLLSLQGVWVRKVRFRARQGGGRSRAQRRRCFSARCASTRPRARKDKRPVDSVWRHLDLGVWRLEIHCRRRRLWCPEHGARTEGVPFARPGSEFTRDFECVVAWLATRTDKTTIKRMLRIDWDTVGRIVKRVCDDELDPGRLNDLFEIGIDEVSWKRQHNYLTLVADHRRGKIVWGTEGAGEKRRRSRSSPSSTREIRPLTSASPNSRDPAGTVRAARRARATGEPTRRRARLQARGDLAGHGPRVRRLSPRATRPRRSICIDPYHVVQLANKALDEVRRAYWNELRRSGDKQAAKRFKDARWCLLKKPEKLTDKQAATLHGSRPPAARCGAPTRSRKPSAGSSSPGLTLEDVTVLIDRLLSRLARSRLEPFVRLGKTIRKHRDGILAAIRLGINQGRTEALNNKVRLITRRAYGFHSAKAALALVMLTCGPITLHLPHELHAPGPGDTDHIDAERA